MHNKSIQVRGHYYQFKILEISKHIRTKELIPVHSKHPELMPKLMKSTNYK